MRRTQLGETHHSAAARKGKAAHKTGQSTQWLEALLLDPPQLAGAGIEQPELALVPTRRVGHGEPRCGDGSCGDVHHHTTFMALIAPTGGRVAGTAGAGPVDLTVLQGDTIEVAAVFRLEGIDEGWLPHRLETAARAELSQAAEHGVDKQRGPLCCQHQLMGIHLTGEETRSRDIETVSAVMVLTGSEQVVEAP